MKVFVSGGTGLIGSRFVRRLDERGDPVVVLTRRPDAARQRLPGRATIVTGDPMQSGPWMDAVRDCDAVVNLVGESIFSRRWNEEFVKLLHDSRVQSTQNVVQALGKAPRTTAGQPKVLVNATAIGYYGPHGDEELTEASPPGDDTLARIAIDWEDAARAAEPLGVRVARIRIGVVLDKEGGALAQMLGPFKVGVGGKIGSGQQYMSWIHHQDMVGILLLALDNVGAAGAINATAPNPVTNQEFTRSLGRVLHRPTVFPVPTFALKLRFGQVAEVLTTGQRVVPQRAVALAYSFVFPALDAALTNLLG
jgi:uncharacterized protein (TIGR01777 family)